MCRRLFVGEYRGGLVACLDCIANGLVSLVASSGSLKKVIGQFCQGRARRWSPGVALWKAQGAAPRGSNSAPRLLRQSGGAAAPAGPLGQVGIKYFSEESMRKAVATRPCGGFR